MDVPPLAQRVSNNYADQGHLFHFFVSTLAMCESMSIPRAAVTPEELSCVRDFNILVVHDESAKVSETKLHKENALKHVALLTARLFVSAALNQLVFQFGMSRDSSKGWVETRTNRLQNLCRTVSQSLRKNPRSEFAAPFPWSRLRQTPLRNLVTLWGTIENSVWLGVVCRTGQDHQRCRARSLCPRERNQPTHRWHVGPTGSSTQRPTSRAKSSKRHRLQTTNETCRLLCGRGSTARANIECS